MCSYHSFIAGLVFSVQDATLFEAVDVTPLQSLGSDKDSNIQYSGKYFSFALCAFLLQNAISLS